MEKGFTAFVNKFWVKETGAPEKYSKYSGFFSIFLSYLILLYINVIYFKFIITFSLYRGNYLGETAMKLLLVALVILGMVFFFVHRKNIFSYKKIRKFAVEVKKPLLIFGMSCLALGTVFFLIDYFKNEPVAEKVKTDSPNIILITHDSLNRFHLSPSNYYRETAPNLNEFIKESYYFENMKANTSKTELSMKSISTGIYPRFNQQSGNITNIAKILKENGYNGNSFISFTYFNGITTRYFDNREVILSFENTWPGRLLTKYHTRKDLWWLSQFLSTNIRFYSIFVYYNPKSMDDKIGDPYPLGLYYDYILNTLRRERQPVFIWAHIFEPHFPYLVPENNDFFFGDIDKMTKSYNSFISTQDKSFDFLRDRYDTSIHYMDEQFGEFLKKLKKMGYYDNSIIIVSSDHGQSLGYKFLNRHVVKGHNSPVLSDTEVNIPLIIHLPEQAKGKMVKTFAEHVDILPTILSLAQVPVPETLEGESLIPYMEDETKMSKKVKISITNRLFQQARKLRGADIKTMDYVALRACWDKYEIQWMKKFKDQKKSKFEVKMVRDISVATAEKDYLYPVNGELAGKLSDKLFHTPLVQYYVNLVKE